MTDTDSEMMRLQQKQDAHRPIELDETRARLEKTDSDAASRSARETARSSHDAVAGHAEEAVLTQNRRSDYSAEAEVFESGDTDTHPPANRPPLAAKDRSLLGD